MLMLLPESGTRDPIEVRIKAITKIPERIGMQFKDMANY